jgi:predicted Zn finger-like uncharacterized protein
MNISCPHCGFSKEVPDNAIPAGTTRANCPRCGQSFALDRPKQAEADFTPAAAAPTVVCPSCKLAQPQANHCSRCGMVLAAQSGSSIYAGFWLRVVAAIIDGLVLTAIQVVCGIFLGVTNSLVGGGTLAGGAEEPHFLVLLLFNLMLGWAYFTVFTGACGQTPGKMVLRLKVIRTDWSDIGYGRAFIREVPGKFLAKAIFFIGYLMVAFTERKQGLHDMIADTYVIKL